MCKCASRLKEPSSEQVVVWISAVIFFIAKLNLLLAVFNQRMLCGGIEKNSGPSYATEKFRLGTIHQDNERFGERGLFVPNGKSVLLKFKDLFELEKYIQVAYLD